MSRWKRLAFWAGFGLILAGAVVLAVRCVTHHLPYFGLYHDDAIYVVTAKSLAEGHGYRILSLPQAPLQTKYPILYPLLLSAVWKLNPSFPQNLLAIDYLNVFLGLCFGLVSAAYLLRTRRISLGMLVVIGGATLLNVKFLSFLPLSMSDSLYGILSVACLWLADRIGGRKPGSLVSAALLGVLEAMATLCRGTGACLAPISAFYLLVRRRSKAATASFGVFLALTAPYWLWIHTHQSLESPSMVYYTSHSRWGADAFRDVGVPVVALRKGHDVFHSVHQLVWPLLGQIPYARLSPVEFFLVYRAGYVLIWAALLAGIWRDLLNRRRCLLPLYFLAYGAGTLLWPGWFEWRIALVVLPFIYYFYYRGFRLAGFAIKGLLPGAPRKSWQMACSVLALFFGAYLVLGSAWSSTLRAGYYPRRLPFRSDITAAAEFSDVLETFEWIRRSTPVEAVFISNNDPLVYLYTGRTGMQPSPYQGWRVHGSKLVTASTLLETMKESQASYILLDPSYQAAYQVYAQMVLALAELQERAPGLLQPKYASPNGVMIVFEIDSKLLSSMPETSSQHDREH
jgi:hypothetical protein